MIGRSGYFARMARNRATPSSPEVVSALKFMSAMTRSTRSRVNISSPSAGAPAPRTSMSWRRKNARRAVMTAGLSSMTKTVLIPVMILQSATAGRGGRGYRSRPERRIERGQLTQQQDDCHPCDEVIAGQPLHLIVADHPQVYGNRQRNARRGA